MDSHDQQFSFGPCRRRWGHGFSSTRSGRAAVGSAVGSFTPAQKLEHLAAYEAACEPSQGGAYLRSEGLFSSLITRVAQAPRRRRAGRQAAR